MSILYDIRSPKSAVRRLKMIIPKGRLFGNVASLLNDSGFEIETDERSYNPDVSDPEVSAKLVKPQNIPSLVSLGTHDIGFCGHDWVEETASDVTEIMDLGFDPVQLVAAIPEWQSLEKLKSKRIIVASEYEHLTRRFLKKEKFDYIFLRTYGATEVFPPDDADMIVDNTSSGRTLTQNKLKAVATLLESSTRFIANPRALKDPWKSEKIVEICTLFKSVLHARERVMLEMNVSIDRFPDLVAMLPCMRAPTVSPLHGNQGFAVKVAVLKKETPALILKLIKMGATDILEYEFRKVVIE